MLELPAAEWDLVGLCVRAAADGPFFDDDEYQTLFGFGRAEMQRVAREWSQVPRGHDLSREVIAAAAGALNNLAGYPHGRDAELVAWTGMSRPDIRRLANAVTGALRSARSFGPVER